MDPEIDFWTYLSSLPDTSDIADTSDNDVNELAVDEYNHRIKDTNKELEFVKVLKSMSQAACVLRFYMTFSAKDLADGGNINTYQAVVLMGVGSEMSVLSFRLKPPDSHGKEWFWEEDDLCNGVKVHVMTFEVGKVLEDAKWQAHVYCVKVGKNSVIESVWVIF
ncbi:uncharacterized protein LOC114292081 [Camellia sinensis]|uniref:uncharacterized protein LOC114292081 n=1 Tax=Camellia sinensis TaxID=4442 RepID=UPI00103608B2|nr:uncharacterized protein LOC114292081 [Camellia sinensis]